MEMNNIIADIVRTLTDDERRVFAALHESLRASAKKTEKEGK